MATELETWEREHFVDGGGEPFLFYVVYGNIDPSKPLSRSAYRSGGAPEGIDLLGYGPDEHPEVPGSFREGYIWDQLVVEDPKLSSTIAECDSCMVLRGTPSDASTLNYLRDTVGLITYLLDSGGCAVYDPLMLQWWSPAAWRERIFDPAAAVPRHHTVILVSEEDDPSLKWFHTRGMLKFGRPDVSLHNVPPERETAVAKLCNALIEHQAFGHIIADGQKLKMESLPPGAVARHGGDMDDPDFNNVHIDVSWPDSA